MKSIQNEYRSLWREYPGPCLLFHSVAVLAGLFVLGAWLATEGYVASAIPFLLIFVAIGLLAYARSPRTW